MHRNVKSEWKLEEYQNLLVDDLWAAAIRSCGLAGLAGWEMSLVLGCNGSPLLISRYFSIVVTILPVY